MSVSQFAQHRTSCSASCLSFALEASITSGPTLLLACLWDVLPVDPLLVVEVVFTLSQRTIAWDSCHLMMCLSGLYSFMKWLSLRIVKTPKKMQTGFESRAMFNWWTTAILMPSPVDSLGTHLWPLHDLAITTKRQSLSIVSILVTKDLLKDARGGKHGDLSLIQNLGTSSGYHCGLRPAYVMYNVSCSIIFHSRFVVSLRITLDRPEFSSGRRCHNFHWLIDTTRNALPSTAKKLRLHREVKRIISNWKNIPAWLSMTVSLNTLHIAM